MKKNGIKKLSFKKIKVASFIEIENLFGGTDGEIGETTITQTNGDDKSGRVKQCPTVVDSIIVCP
jgi:hypothetical protein